MVEVRIIQKMLLIILKIDFQYFSITFFLLSKYINFRFGYRNTVIIFFDVQYFFNTYINFKEWSSFETFIKALLILSNMDIQYFSLNCFTFKESSSSESFLCTIIFCSVTLWLIKIVWEKMCFSAINIIFYLFLMDFNISPYLL